VVCYAQKWSTKKRIFMSMVPAVAGVGWWIVHTLRRRPIPRNRALALRLPASQKIIIPTGGATFAAKYPQGKDYEEGQSSRPRGNASERDTAQVGKAPTGHALHEDTAEKYSLLLLLIPFLIFAVLIVLFSFNKVSVQSRVVVPGGDVERGRVALQSWGCGSCHTIPGVVGASGKVGPDLKEVGIHSFIAGHLENTPENMSLWIQKPQEISPGNGMPDTGVTVSMARDMAAYLYSLSDGQNPETGPNSFQFKR
jgi:cytochrome c